jgi:ribonuclease inhibitor
MRRVQDLDRSEIENEGELHDVLARNLAVPDFYGRKRDAFWDYITDPDLSDMPAVLRVSAWATLHARLPRAALLLKKCLDDLRLDRPECRVEWVD